MHNKIDCNSFFSNTWENQRAVKRLFTKYILPVCEKYHLKNLELVILMFLHQNPKHDTASEIIEIKCLAKSQVSMTVSSLEKKVFCEKNIQKAI